MPSESAVAQVWIWSLVIYFVVVRVVAVLLTVILNTVKQIRGGAAAIWTSGQKVANNTIQIPCSRGPTTSSPRFWIRPCGRRGQWPLSSSTPLPVPTARRASADLEEDGMNTFVILMIVTLVGVAALFIALALFVRAIVRELEVVGGPATRFVRPVNYLSKIRLGLESDRCTRDTLLPR